MLIFSFYLRRLKMQNVKKSNPIAEYINQSINQDLFGFFEKIGRQNISKKGKSDYKFTCQICKKSYQEKLQFSEQMNHATI